MENLKTLFDRLLSENKKIVIATLAKEYGLSESSVRTNWFSSWKIPDHCQSRTHELLIKTLKSQFLKTKNFIN